MTDGASLRERKKLETRTALTRAAVRLYLRDGPSAVTVQEICEAAGVSPRTFFNYFDTKDDAVFDWDHRLTHQLLEEFAARPADEHPLTSLHRAVEATLPGMVDDPDWHARGKLMRAHPELVPKLMHNNRRMEEALVQAAAARAGLPEDALHPRLVAGTGLVALRTALRGWDPQSGTRALLDRVDETFTALATGLPAPA
ncbi:TetR/AcrR family transcriptional regulator [Streptomyces sp. HNM0574]|uniref:TetR/AcrR family transcriptional regulator n=1 Tax=Streptomyces sp. HNM0574 TaxID=2714954 RepID=UPI00146DB9DD|nr:TetR/AcrR family transcriptional regulator [Streptomyces sp. HNM0574]NLU69000.1 TetR family transcriptional regulator [Streptomyces sp. HNM0574]